MIGVVKLVAAVLAGVGIGDILDNIFRGRQTPVQAVVGVNWIRVGITVALIIGILFVLRRFLGLKMEV